MLYPLTFLPDIHDALWGCESWEISGHHSSPSIVAEGALAGATLEELALRFGAELTGTKALDPTRFPLLFKVIDARDRLSVQVHPNESTAAIVGGEPKTEMWCSLADEGYVFAGLKPGTGPDKVEDDVRTGLFEDTLARHDMRKGDVMFIPGGLVHAIGENTRLYEVQQSSDTTYRLYDWGRTGTDGKPRTLHIAESLKCIDFSLPVPEARQAASCQFFRFRQIQAEGTLSIAANPDSFTALYITETRRSVLVPACCAAEMPCRGKVLVTTLS